MLQPIENDKNDNSLVIIPARLNSTRLPQKALKEIHGKSMIWHVWSRAVKSSIGPVIVATDSNKIADIIISEGGDAILTKKDHASGSDRVYEALEIFDPNNKFDLIINLQGDVPNFNPMMLKQLVSTKQNADIGTLVSIAREDEINDPSVVKTVVSWENNLSSFKKGKALYFSRASIPFNSKKFWHHIGVYSWKRKSLEKFISLPISNLEETEKLEQLRALEAGMSIEVSEIKDSPIGVDTIDDLNKVRKMMSKQ